MYFRWFLCIEDRELAVKIRIQGFLNFCCFGFLIDTTQITHFLSIYNWQSDANYKHIANMKIKLSFLNPK